VKPRTQLAKVLVVERLFWATPLNPPNPRSKRLLAVMENRIAPWKTAFRRVLPGEPTSDLDTAILGNAPRHGSLDELMTFLTFR
jgi:hypothetical protein